MSQREAKNIDNVKRLGKNFIFFSKLAFQSAPYAFVVCWSLNIISSIFPAITSKVFGNLINSIVKSIESGITGPVWTTLIIYIIINILPSIINVFEMSSTNILYLRFGDFIDQFMLKVRGNLDIAHIENSEFQDKIQKAFNNGTGPVTNLIDAGISAAQMALVVVINSVVILATDWKIFACVIVLSIPKFIVEVKYGGRIYNIAAEDSKNKRTYQELRSFFVSKFAVIESKLFQIQEFFLQKVDKILGHFTKEQVKIEHERSRYRLLSEILASIGMFGGLSIIIYDALHGRANIGTIAFIFSLISSFSSNAKAFLLNFARLLERNLYVSDIYDLLQTKPIITEIINPINISPDITPEIEFRNVSFKYPDQNNFVLKNISFIMKSGSKLGLVGHNGAGKTTIVRLLLRIHDPTEGQVLINGVDLRELKIQDWWGKLAVLPQDFSSFHFETKYSISYGDIKRECNIEQVKTAAKQSTASDFIETWKDSYERMIGSEFGGAELSKGERQKMALARIFYRNAPVFILDEPTAAVDSTSTSEIFRNIEKIPDKQSVLIISHNFATLRRANDIIVLEHGQIVESGDHEALIKKKGLYAKLYKQQKSEFE